MKRWLVASLGLNLVLIGMFVGFSMTAALPPLPFLPPGKMLNGFERDLYKIIQVLEPEAQNKAKAILEKNFVQTDDRAPLPRPGGLIQRFQDGDVRPEPPKDLFEMHARRAEELKVIHTTVYELSKVLNQSQRDKIAAQMRNRIQEMKRCVNKG